MRRSQSAQRASRRVADSSERVSAVRGARRNGTRSVELDVGSQVSAQGEGVTSLFALFQSELVGRRVNLTEVVDASIGLRGSASFDEVRNRDRRQEADDGHDNHDFDEGEARRTEVFVSFHFTFVLRGVNEQQAGLYDYNFVHRIACCNRDTTRLAESVPAFNGIIHSLFTGKIHRKRSKS